MAKYAWSDTHFWHKKIITPDFSENFRKFNTIHEHNDFIIDAANSVVQPEDTLWHMGDVFLWDSKDEAEVLLNMPVIMGKLKGKHKLIVGNHDTNAKIERYRPYFSKIVGYEEIIFGGNYKVMMSHIPIHPSQLKKRFVANIHGHVHSDTLDDPRYINVSLEALDKYVPVRLNDLIDKRVRPLLIPNE